MRHFCAQNTRRRQCTVRKPQVANRVHLRLEALEDRCVMSSLFISDMTQLAAEFPRHAGATTLWLNFDGNTAQGVSSFQSISGNRNQDIHDILFRTQEIFAPFDVIVQRRYGDGNTDTSSNGNSTVFIGDKASYGTGTGNFSAGTHDEIFGNFVDNDETDAVHVADGARNGAGAYTPWASSDFPSSNKGYDHAPNSDAYDIAFVDPIYYSGGSNVSRGTQWIARAIAHEAGHTFGLVHVLSNPDQEIMSYDATNVRFVNKTFNITDLNYNPSTGSNYDEPKLQPKWYTYWNFGFGSIQILNTITTQDSFTYLQTALGNRSTAGDFANIADPTAVDSSYVDGTMYTMSVGSSVTASIGRPGDFDVYSFTPTVSQWVTIDVHRWGSSYLNGVLWVYNSTGKTRLGLDDDSGGNLGSRLTMYVTAGTNYKLAVGGYGGGSTGTYEMTINPYYLVFNPTAT